MQEKSEINNKVKRRQRSDKGQIQWQDRDTHFLKWIGEQYRVRLDILQILYAQLSTKDEIKRKGFVTEKAVENRLSKYRQKQYIEVSKLQHGQPKWVWLTSKGLRAVELSFTNRERAESKLKHDNLCNLVRLSMEISGYKWHRPERQLWRDMSGQSGRVPDGEFIHNGKITPLEVERSRKPQDVTEAINKLLRQYEQVLYVVVNDTKNSVENVLKDKHRVSILHVDDLFESLPYKLPY